MDTRGGGSGSTWACAYDAGGNITSKKLYALAYGDSDLSDNTVVHDYAYTYNVTWKDKLASYDGNAITYDNIGNPLTYNGWTYTWEAGRQLKQMVNGSMTLQFKYNDAGLRTQKINGSITTKYYWSGSVISHMTSGSNTLHFYYDAAEMPTMVTYNGTNYYYKLNLQGDIIGIMDMSGNTVVSYVYDSWGKQLSCTGSLAGTLGAANPLRYRGYIFDEDSGLYYLQSRYYNPEWGRFINADKICNNSTILGNNIFIYCDNNPIVKSDPNGNRPLVLDNRETNTPSDEELEFIRRTRFAKAVDDLIEKATGKRWGLTGSDDITYRGKTSPITYTEFDATAINVGDYVIDFLLGAYYGRVAGRYIAKIKGIDPRAIWIYEAKGAAWGTGFTVGLINVILGHPAKQAGTYQDYYYTINGIPIDIQIGPYPGTGGVYYDIYESIRPPYNEI